MIHLVEIVQPKNIQIWIANCWIFSLSLSCLFTMDPLEYVNRPLLEPSWEHPFGTNGQGQDIFGANGCGFSNNHFDWIWVGYSLFW